MDMTPVRQVADYESDGSASNDEGLRVIGTCSRSGFCMYLLR